MEMRYITENSREIPIIASYDVVVVGGGTAGITAALAASRNGAKTALVEKNGYLGGAITAALMPQISAGGPGLMGIGNEIIDRVIKEGNIPTEEFLIPIDAELFKITALEMMVEEKVDVKLYSLLVGAIVEDNSLKGIIVENKSGRGAMLADVIIDASGDGDLSYYAGVPYKKGRNDGKMRPITQMFKMGNIDIEEMTRFALNKPDQFAQDPRYHIIKLDEGLVRLVGYFNIVEEAKKEGELFSDCHYIRVEGVIPEQKVAVINATRVYDVDGTSEKDLIKATIEGYNQIRQLIKVLKERVPGFGKSSLIQIASDPGVRETRHIEGQYKLTLDDIVADRIFEDTVLRSYKRQFPDQPSHSPDGKEGAEGDKSARIGTAPVLGFNVPYRAMLPKEIKGLLVTGRCISQTHEADGFTRPQSCCMTIGQAAGAAAALSIRKNVSPDKLLDSIKELQDILVSEGIEIPLGKIYN